MVQMDSHFDYDADMENTVGAEERNPAWSGVIRDSIREFVTTLSESSKQLATAAEKFAGESLHVIDDATTKAERSASDSTQMAAAAGQAAQEARHIAETVRQSILDASERVKEESQRAFHEAGAQTAETRQIADQLRAEIDARLQDVLQRVEASIETSQEAATVAQSAASEASQTNQSMRTELQRIETNYGAGQEAVGAAQRAASEASATSEYLAGEVKRLDESLQRLEAGANSNQETITALQRTVNESSEASRQIAADFQRIDQSVQRVEAGYNSSQEMLAAAQRAAEESVLTSRSLANDVLRVDASLSRLEASVVLSHETSLASQHAAEEARQAAVEARGLASAMTDSGFGSSAHELLERLEADYQLLTRLVQELHSRITGLSGRGGTAAPLAEASPPAPLYQPESYTPNLTTVEDGETPETEEPEAVAAPETRTGWPQVAQEPEAVVEDSEVSDEDEHETAAEPRVWQAWPQPQERVPEAEPNTALHRGWAELAAEPDEEQTVMASTDETLMPQGEGEVRTANLTGRIMVQVSPVPDFDRLLTLDGALGRMPEIRNVTLADYAKEEVTFRVELDNELSAQDFTRKLGESSGNRMELVSANADTIALRLVA